MVETTTETPYLLPPDVVDVELLRPQFDVLDSREHQRAYIAARQTGKSLVAELDAVSAFVHGIDTVYVSPSMSQSRDAYYSFIERGDIDVSNCGPGDGISISDGRSSVEFVTAHSLNRRDYVDDDTHLIVDGAAYIRGEDLTDAVSSAATTLLVGTPNPGSNSTVFQLLKDGDWDIYSCNTRDPYFTNDKTVEKIENSRPPKSVIAEIDGCFVVDPSEL